MSSRCWAWSVSKSIGYPFVFSIVEWRAKVHER
jgi:hypothetical protein